MSAIGENLLALHGRGIPHALTQQFVELNTYNHEFERLNGKHAFDRLDSLLPTLGAIDSRADREDLQRIDEEYGKADALAIYYQRHSDRLFRGFSYTASVMALLFLVYAKLVGQQRAALGLSHAAAAQRRGVPSPALAPVVLQAPHLSRAGGDDAHQSFFCAPPAPTGSSAPRS